MSSSLCARSHLFLLFAFVFGVVYISLNSHRIILSLNVRGTQSSTKRKSLFLWLNRQEADIIFPQETCNTKEGEAFRKTQYKGKMFFLDGTNHSCGDLVYVSERWSGIRIKIFCSRHWWWMDFDGCNCAGIGFFIRKYLYIFNRVQGQCTFFGHLDEILEHYDTRVEQKFVIGRDCYLGCGSGLLGT